MQNILVNPMKLGSFLGKISIFSNLAFSLCDTTDALKVISGHFEANHRVSIEWKSPYEESYTVNSHWKTSDYIFIDVRACVRSQIKDRLYRFSIFSLDVSYKYEKMTFVD